jgi:hypothetical protein
MRIAVIGTGVVGRTLAGRCAELGHETVVGTRDVSATLSRTDGDGSATVADWLAANPAVRLLDLPSAGGFGELVVNATNGAASLQSLAGVGAENLAGKVLVDVANPLDFSRGFPPTLLVKDDDCLGEQIQREFPDARVVKTLNTVTAAVMVDPGQVGDGGTTVFLSGDDAPAKALVAGLLAEFGWRDILDLGDITTARGTEMYLPLWLRILGARNSPQFNIRVVG